MRRTEQSSLVLALGLWVSLGLHVALGLGFARYSGAIDPELARADEAPTDPRSAAAEEPSKPLEERELRLGVAGGSPATLTWLGFREETEHGAPQGMVEQSAMSLDPGQDADAPGQALPPAPPPAPSIAEVPAIPDEVVLTPTEANAGEAPTMDRETAERLADRVRRIAEDASAATELIVDSVQKLLEPNEAAATPPAPAPEVQQPEVQRPQPHSPPSSPKTGGQGTPGLQADRESIAVAVKNAPGVKPGKVLAAEGLEILTRQPKFAVTTLLTRRPRNPTVAVTFGRDGRVVRAVFVNDGARVYNTGDESIDQPLLNAIYTWSARGEALKEIDPNDPQAGIRVMFTILLGG